MRRAASDRLKADDIELANAIVEERSVSEFAIELPLGKAGQLDDELDYQMPLASNQVGEAAVEITR
jgi:hypothetical protein